MASDVMLLDGEERGEGNDVEWECYGNLNWKWVWL